MVDVLLGLQWGDEGKGKIVDFLASRYDIIARFQGGPNAGHTLYIDGKKVVLHTVPSGIFHDHCTNLIGNGVVIDPVTLLGEIDTITALRPTAADRLLISSRAHLILPTHRALDAASELSKGSDKIGSTLKGIGPAYMDKTGRNGIRVGDLLSPDFGNRYSKIREKHLQLLSHYHSVPEGWQEWEQAFFRSIERVRQLRIVDGAYWLEAQLAAGKKVLAEGAQGSMLDIEFGTYPFVTSSNTLSSGACSGLGIAPARIGEVYGITKAYCTRVGSGPFPTELDGEAGEALRKAGGEFGATTGRPRRCGWMDLVALRYACLLSGVTQLIMTKTDVLDGFSPLEVCTAYEINGQETDRIPFDCHDAKVRPVYRCFDGWQDRPLAGVKNAADLPEAFRRYKTFIEEYLGTPVKYVSNGVNREQLLCL